MMSNVRRLPNPFSGRPRARIVALAITVLTAAGLIMGLAQPPGGARSTRAQSDFPQFWPSFTMVYTVREVDPASNAVVLDQTRRLQVANEFSWQEEVVRDGINPKEVGSTRQFQNQAVCYYSADKNHRYCHDPLPPRMVTSVVVPELSPGFLPSASFLKAGID